MMRWISRGSSHVSMVSQEEHNKRKTWGLVSQLAKELGNRWICFGDFNDILVVADKKDGNNRSISRLNWNRQTVSNSGIHDMGFEGYIFTWKNGMQDLENIQFRINRGLATSEFANRFPSTKVLHLPRFRYDHDIVLTWRLI